ncbi:MAG: vanadium-dependent haloperoxidase, partial [Sediminibacterium sp.]|nr:vanadium-dependent haloperoxidase [Sediminibacterium sp.]
MNMPTLTEISAKARMKQSSSFFVVFVLVACFGCRQKNTAKLDDAEILHRNQDMLTQVIIYDVFTPPVA